MIMHGRFNCKCIEEGSKTLEKQGAYLETALMLCMTSGEEWPTMQVPVGYYKPTKKKVRLAMNYASRLEK